MGIYIIILFLIFALWIVFNNVKFTVGNEVKSNDKNRAYIVCIGISMFIVAALRNYTVGRDVYNYLRRYARFADAEWKEIFYMADSMMFEHGFAILNKLLTYINKNPRFFLVIAAFFIIFSYGMAIYRYSTIPWLSFLLFMTMGFFGSSLNVIRQYIAVAIILFSYNAIKNNKLLEFIVLVLVASNIHTSAIIVLPMYWLSKIKFNKFTLFAIFSLFLSGAYVFIRYSKTIIAFMAPYMHTYNRYLGELERDSGNGAIGATLIYAAFLILIIIELYNSEEEIKNMYIAFAIASVMLILFSYAISISERALPYFSSMFIFSVPKAITSEKKRRIRIQYVIVICVVLIAYYFAIICRANTGAQIPYELWNCNNTF